MTHEESKALWRLEKEHINKEFLSDGMKNLYETVDKLIEENVITYDDFTQDLLNALTEIVKEEQADTLEQRQENINTICITLIEKYNVLIADKDAESTDE